MSVRMPEAPSRNRYAVEIRRKLLHVAALVIPIGILIIPSPWDAVVLGILGATALVADIVRARNAAVKAFIERVFGGLMRREELPRLNGKVAINGATWMCLSAALCAVLFPTSIAATAMAILIIGDAAAAAIGIHFGRNRYPWSRKTLEGTLGFAVAGVIAAMPFGVLGEPALDPGAVIIATVLAAVIEALPLPINDNLLVPLLAASVMLLLTG